MKTMAIDDRLAKNRFDSDDVNPHIIINKVACKTCQHQACLTCCPAERYRWDFENNQLLFDHVGCLECGNCRFICDRMYDEIEDYFWNFPVAGAGILYREG